MTNLFYCVVVPYYPRWYIFEENAVCLWTGIFYITYLKTSISGAWYVFYLLKMFYFIWNAREITQLN